MGAGAPAPSGASPQRSARPSMPQGNTQAIARTEVQPRPEEQLGPRSFADIITLAETQGERMLRAEMMRNVHLVSFQPGQLEIRLSAGAVRDLPNRISRFLGTVTGTRWMVTVVQTGGAETIGEQQDSAARDKRAEVTRHPLMRSILDAFPGAELEQVRAIGPALLPAAMTMDAPAPAFGAEYGEDDYADVDPDGDLDL